MIITYIHNTWIYHVTSKDLPKIPNKRFHHLREESSMSLMLPYKLHVVQCQHSTAAAIFQHRGRAARPVAVPRSWEHESSGYLGLVGFGDFWCKCDQSFRPLGTICSDNTISNKGTASKLPNVARHRRRSPGASKACRMSNYTQDLHRENFATLPAMAPTAE